MVLWNPALVVGLRAGRDSRSVRPNHGYLIRRIDFLRATRGSFRPFPALSTTTLLWEQSTDPGVVDEIACAGESCEEEEVEEDAVNV